MRPKKTPARKTSALKSSAVPEPTARVPAAKAKTAAQGTRSQPPQTPAKPAATAKPGPSPAPKPTAKPTAKLAAKTAPAPAQATAPAVKRLKPRVSAVVVKPVARPVPRAKSGRKPSPRVAASAAAPVAGAVLPQVLFEGDHPPLPSVSGPGRRYALGPTAPSAQFQAVEELGELPEAYGTKRLFVAARDPHWLYAHWDFTLDQLRQCNAESADRHLVLRVSAGEPGAPACAEVHVHPESRNWFVHVGRGGTKYYAELGYYRKTDRNWVSLSRSAATLTPPDSVAEEAPAHFATIPIEVPLETLVALVRAAAKENVPLAEAILHLAADGFEGLPVASDWPKTEWTPEREQALAEAVAGAVSMDTVRRVWVGSLEITELLRRRLVAPVSSQALGAVGAPGAAVGELEIGGLGSVSSPFGQAAAPGRGFWFNINAELIIYGATEPDATVTVGDRRIKLRPDGSFSFRFALPDGRYTLPVQAASADGVETRSAALEFLRTTQRTGEVAVHPQDPALKKPASENVQ